MTNLQYQSGAIDAGGCISNGWQLVKPNYGVFLGMTTLFIVGSIVLSCIPIVGGVLFSIVLGPALTIGMYRAFFREMDGARADFGMLFSGFEKMGVAVIIGLVQSIPSIIWTIFSMALNVGSIFTEIIQKQTGRGYGNDFAMQNDMPPALAGGMLIVIVIAAVVMLIFSIGWAITFFFALPIVAEHDVTAMEAIKLSASAGWSNVGGLIALFIFEFLICLLGVLALCIGILFVIPIVFAANAFAYRQVFPWVRQNFNTAPPPPDQYGFGGGQAQQY